MLPWLHRIDNNRIRVTTKYVTMVTVQLIGHKSERIQRL